MPRSLLFCVALLGTFLPIAHAQDADTSLAFLLSETVSLDATYDAAARQTPTSVTVITAQEIEQFGYRTLGEALEHVRGFFVTYNQVYTHLGVRGFGDPGDLNRRVLIAIDGTSTHEFTYGSAFAERALGVPLEGLERIEVIRGPGSTRYGNGAMLIVVNLVPRPGGRLEGVRSWLSLDSNGAREGGFAAGAQPAPDREWSVFGTGTYAPGRAWQFDPSTASARADDREQAFSILLRGQIGAWHGLVTVSERTKRIPTGAWESVFGASLPFRDRSSRFEARYEKQLSPRFALTARATGAYYGFEGRYAYEDGDDAWQDTEVTAHVRAGLHTTATWDPLARLRYTVGGVALRHPIVRYRYTEGDETTSRFDVPLSQTALFAEQEWTATPALSFTLGGRFDAYSVDRQHAFSPRLAMVYARPSGATVKLLYSTAFRVPSAYERESAHGSGLRPEKLRSAELAWSQPLAPGTALTVAAFTTYIDGLIELSIDPADPTQELYDNGSDGTSRGVETEVTSALPGGGFAYASGSLVRARFAGSNQPLPNAPAWMARAGLRLPVRSFVAGAQMRAEGRRLTRVPGEYTGAFALADATLTTPPLWGRVKAHLRLTNLLDTSYRLPASDEVSWTTLPQYGRTLTLALHYGF